MTSQCFLAIIQHHNSEMEGGTYTFGQTLNLSAHLESVLTNCIFCAVGLNMYVWPSRIRICSLFTISTDNHSSLAHRYSASGDCCCIMYQAIIEYLTILKYIQIYYEYTAFCVAPIRVVVNWMENNVSLTPLVSMSKCPIVCVHVNDDLSK